MNTILDEAQRALVRDVRALLERLRAALDGWDRRPAEVGRLADAAVNLDELFLLVVAGEFNAGKSAFINALLQGNFLEQGVTPTTAEVQLLTFGQESDQWRDGGVLYRQLPAPLLREVHVVDTPGTNAVVRGHERLTRDFIPRADMVLFVTSADRAFSESERDFLEMISGWGKKVVLLINKIDLLENDSDVTEVEEFVSRHAEEVLGGAAPTFAISAKLALADRTDKSLHGWHTLTDYLEEVLGQTERFRLKLENPLGVAERVIADADAEISARRTVLERDSMTLEAIGAEIDAFEESARVAFAASLDRIDGVLAALRERGEAFLDDRLRLVRIRGLLDGDRLRAEFEREVIGPSPDAIAGEISSAIDGLIDDESKCWRSIRARLDAGNVGVATGAAAAGSIGSPLAEDRFGSSRKGVGASASGGAVALMPAEAAPGTGADAGATAGTGGDHGAGQAGFAARRRGLLASLGNRAESVLAGFEPAQESLRLERDVQDTLARTAMLEVGALGLGVLIPLLTTAHLLDFTGALAGSILAAVGLTLLPYRRRKAAELLRQRVAELRDELRGALSQTFARELDRSSGAMRAAVAPYGTFIETESRALGEIDSRLRAATEEIAAIRARVQAVE